MTYKFLCEEREAPTLSQHFCHLPPPFFCFLCPSNERGGLLLARPSSPIMRAFIALNDKVFALKCKEKMFMVCLFSTIKSTIAGHKTGRHYFLICNRGNKFQNLTTLVGGPDSGLYLGHPV